MRPNLSQTIFRVFIFSLYPFLFLLFFFPELKYFAGTILLLLSFSEAFISLMRNSFFKFIFMTILFMIVLLGFLPYVGIVFKIIGFFLSFLRILFMGNVHIMNFSSYEQKKKPIGPKVYDVDYKEKK